ncbi:hypothetical protein [Kribbella sp. NPDC048915]|uniref:hypothetical protein n=1 Tax=Kribbella sp. NPDC048915 TaxID=3155148 RepID=UPI00340EB83D
MATRDGRTGQLKGAELERRVGLVEFADGSLVRLRHPVTQQIDGRRRIVTDVDVLSLEFDSRLRPRVGITECKSTRGQAGEQDRLLWLKGLQTVVGADRAALVREVVSSAGRDLARILNLDLISQDEIGRRERLLTHLPTSFGLFGETPYAEAVKAAEGQLKLIGDLPSGLVAFLRDDALLAEPHQVLGALITLDEITKSGTVLPGPLASIVAGYALTALMLAAIRAGGRTDTVGLDGARREIELGLGSGDPNDKQMLRVAEMADRLLREELRSIHMAYRAQGANGIERRVPSVRAAIAEPPFWLPRFMDLAERLRRRTPIARQLPQTIDLAVLDALPGGSAWLSPAFDGLFTREHRQAIVIAVDCLERAVPAISRHVHGVLDLKFDRGATAALVDQPSGVSGTTQTLPAATSEEDQSPGA